MTTHIEKKINKIKAGYILLANVDILFKYIHVYILLYYLISVYTTSITDMIYDMLLYYDSKSVDILIIMEDSHPLH